MNSTIQTLDAWFSREEYDRKACFHDLPPSVIATKPDETSAHWSKGEARNFNHNCWKICTSDLEKVFYKTTQNCYFNNAIDYGSIRMSDTSGLHDCLTKKIFCINLLTTARIGLGINAASVVTYCSLFDELVRWRRSISLNRFSHLTSQHFEDFVERVCGDALDMGPMLARLDRLVTDIRAGRMIFPVRPVTKDHHRTPKLLDWRALADLLGANQSMLSRSDEFRSGLIDRFPDLCPVYAKQLSNEAAKVTAVKPDTRTTDQILVMLSSWSYLDHFSVSGLLDHDPLRFSPFKLRSASSIAAQLGRPRGRTATIDPPNLLKLLDCAAKWILDYAPHVLHAIAVSKSGRLSSKKLSWTERLIASNIIDSRLPAGMPKLWVGWKIDPKRDTGDVPRLSLDKAVGMVIAACAILIGGFGARRIGEITSLQAGCISEAKPGLCELTIYIEKTLRDLERIPVPPMLKTAVNVLERLSESTREATGKAWLFRIFRKKVSRNGFIDPMLNRRITEFIQFNSLADGSACLAGFKSHQLRRGFAIAYYHGYLGASLDALSRFMDHFDPEVTRIYINEILHGVMGRMREETTARTIEALATMPDDQRQRLLQTKAVLNDLAERSAVFDEVRCEAMVHRLLQMFDGTETPIGRGAARLHADLDTMVAASAADVRIGPRSNDPDATRVPLEAALKRYVAVNRLEPVPGHAAHCGCRPGNEADLEEAECLREKAGHRRPWSPDPSPTPSLDKPTWPDHAFSGMYVCFRCAHCVVFSENMAVVDAQQQRLEDAAVRGASRAARENAAGKHARHKALVAAARSAVADRQRH